MDNECRGIEGRASSKTFVRGSVLAERGRVGDGIAHRSDLDPGSNIRRDSSTAERRKATKPAHDAGSAPAPANIEIEYRKAKAEEAQRKAMIRHMADTLIRQAVRETIAEGRHG